MFDFLKLPELPELDQSLNKLRTERPVVAGVVVGSVAVFVLGQATHRYLRLRQKAALAREAHAKRIQAWQKEHQENLRLREAESEDSTTFEADADAAYALWLKGVQLGCPSDVLQGVIDILGQTMLGGIQECLEQKDHSWSFRQRLLDLAKRAEEMCLQKTFGKVWDKVVKVRREIWVENFTMLARVVRRSAGSRVCRLAITVAVAYFTDAVATSSSEAYDQWTESVTELVGFGQMMTFASHYLVISLIEGLLDTISTRITKYLSSSFKKEVDRSLYNSLVKQDTAFFDTHTAEEIEQLSNITEDLQDADDRLHRTVRQLVRCMLRTKTLFTSNHKLFAATVLVYGVYQSASQLSTKVIDLFALEPDQQSDASNLAGLCRNLNFIMENIKLLRVNNRETELVHTLVQRRALDDDDLENQYSVVQRFVDSAASWALAAIRCFGLWCGAVTIAHYNLEDISPETYLSQTFILCGEWGSIDFSWLPVYAANTATMVHMLESKPNIEREDGLMPDHFRGKIEFRKVYFAYPARPDITVLRGVSFVIEAGQSVAFVGKSGSGKSTCMCLLQRLYAPSRGQILLDDIPIEEYNTAWLRKQVGVVVQETTLFDMSVEENIKLGHPEATQAEVIAAAKAAHAWEFILSLPSGLQTRLGHGSVNLSGGQKQRLNIARALLKQPTIMLLDEFTSALDNVCEAKVVKALGDWMDGRTVISIAHRLGSIANVDKVFVFAKGQVVEQGTIAELHQLNGFFRKLSDPGLPNVSFSSMKSDDVMSMSFNSEPPPKEERKVATTGLDPAVVRGMVEGWEDTVKWVQALVAHPEVQSSLALKAHVRNGSTRFEKTLNAKREILPKEYKQAPAMDFARECSARTVSKWGKVKSMTKILAMSRSMGSFSRAKSAPTDTDLCCTWCLGLWRK